MLVQLMSKYRMREVYKPSMVDLSICFYQYSKSCDHQWVWFIAGVLPRPLHAFQGCGKPGGEGKGEGRAGGRGRRGEGGMGGREGGRGGGGKECQMQPALTEKMKGLW